MFGPRVRRPGGPLLGLAMLASLSSGCTEPEALDVDTSAAGSQCGPTWDLQDVEQYDGTLGLTSGWMAAHEGPVGYHVRPGCSGTLISNDLFISAGHCGYRLGDTVRFNYQRSPGGTIRPSTDTSVTAILEQRNDFSYDYAIVRLSGSPGATFGATPINPVDAPVGSLVTLIGHPARVPKAVHAGPLIGYNSSLGPNWFRHRVDTTGGSSGSGVIDEDGRLVGVHTNAGCSTVGTTSGNSAVRMSQIYATSATLQGLAPCTFSLASAEIASSTTLNVTYTHACPSTSFQLRVEGEPVGSAQTLATGTNQSVSLTLPSSSLLAIGNRAYFVGTTNPEIASTIVDLTGVTTPPDAGVVIDAGSPPDVGSGVPDLGTIPDVGTAPDTGGTGLPQILSPAPGSTLNGSSPTFTWTAGSTPVTQWHFEVGPAPLTGDFFGGVLLSSGTTSINTSGLPTSGTMVVTLSYLIGDEWSVVTETYTGGTGGGSPDVGVPPTDVGVPPFDAGTPPFDAGVPPTDAGVSIDAGAPSGPTVLSPAPGSSITGGSTTFTWTAGGTPVSQWHFEIGSSPVTGDIVGGILLSGSTTSQAVSGLPTDGRTVYLTLSYFTGGAWSIVVEAYTLN